MAERLKLALERARRQRYGLDQMRLTAQRISRQTPGSGVQLPVPMEPGWDTVPEVEIDPSRLAEARVSTVLAGGADGRPFDALAARLHRLFEHREWRRLSVLAPTRGCGTTTCSLNLAFSFVHSVEATVLLVDMHDAAPAIAERLGLPKELSGMAKGREHDIPDGDLFRFGDRLLISTPTPVAKKLPARRRVAETLLRLDRLQARFNPDLIVMDMPPVLSGDAADVLLTAADAALLVTSAERTAASELDESARRVDQATQYLGAVLNKSTDRAMRGVVHDFA